MRSQNLVGEMTRSCGCLAIDMLRERRRKHGMSASPIYKVWSVANDRCENPRNKSYADYGGRGIQMKLTFVEFAAELGPRPSPDHSVDRMDNDGNYEKGNLRWATQSEQNLNKRNARRYFEYDPITGVERELEIEEYVKPTEPWLPPQRRLKVKAAVPRKVCPGCDRPLRECACEDWEENLLQRDFRKPAITGFPKPSNRRVEVPDIPSSVHRGSSLADRVRVLSPEEWARL